MPSLPIIVKFAKNCQFAENINIFQNDPKLQECLKNIQNFHNYPLQNLLDGDIVLWNTIVNSQGQKVVSQILCCPFKFIIS